MGVVTAEVGEHDLGVRGEGLLLAVVAHQRLRGIAIFRTIFSTVRAPHEPAFTVESFAITHTGRPSMRTS